MKPIEDADSDMFRTLTLHYDTTQAGRWRHLAIVLSNPGS